MKLPRFLRFEKYETRDVKEFLSKGLIEVHLKAKPGKKMICCRCSTELSSFTGDHYLKLKHLPITEYACFLILRRRKGYCPTCKKTRSETIPFLSKESPHMTKEYSWWLGRLCEISAVKNAGELTGNDKTTMWRLDFNRMKRMFQNYKIPPVKKISVDEVYARRRKYYAKESRDKRFFTIVCDLETRRVIWVSESRSKEALDEFFKVIGSDACKDIEVVAGDQHDPYRASMLEHCPKAVFIWDRFHIMQTFEQAVTEDRAWLHRYTTTGESKRLTRSRFANLFLKKEERRTKEETKHINQVMLENHNFVYLELIKEGMFQIYNSKNAEEARNKFEQMKEWIDQTGFYSLQKWWKNFDRGWDTFKNYFTHRVSSSLSEGMNNVIKTIKKRAYGYRNMSYFKLKIMQVCGYLNSKYVPSYF